MLIFQKVNYFRSQSLYLLKYAPRTYLYFPYFIISPLWSHKNLEHILDNRDQSYNG